MAHARNLQNRHNLRLYAFECGRHCGDHDAVEPLHVHDDGRDFRFCPRCGGGLERRSLKATEPERLVCAACAFVFYLDPKIAVGTIIRTDTQRLVLVRRAIEPGYGKWVFPGGYVDRGEPLTDAAIREAREECGLDVRLDALVNIYSYPGRTPIIVVYAATAIGGTLCIDDECLESAEFEAERLPWDQLAFRSTHEGLHDYLSGMRHPVIDRRSGSHGPGVGGRTWPDGSA
jgi:8-oxo-dGTP diphosphatase